MEMEIYFPGGKRVNADYKGFTIETDQPTQSGGENSAPAPFDLFIGSIGTCAGIFVLEFMQQRGISVEGAKLTLRGERDPETKLIGKISIDIQLPAGFPDQYREAVIRAAELCSVKRHLHRPPLFEIHALPAASHDEMAPAGGPQLP